MWNELKSHPYVIGGAVLGIIVLFFLIGGNSGGVTASAPTDSSGDVAAAEATNQAGIMANAQIQSNQISLAGLKEQIGGSIAVETIRAHTADNANDLAAGVAAQQINANAHSVDLANTLSAQTQQRYFQSQETITAINTNGMLENSRTIADALVEQSRITSSTAIAGYDTTAAIARSHDENSGGLFGGGGFLGTGIHF